MIQGIGIILRLSRGDDISIIAPDLQRPPRRLVRHRRRLPRHALGRSRTSRPRALATGTVPRTLPYTGQRWRGVDWMTAAHFGGSRKVGAPQGRVLACASRGDSQESATENKPPVGLAIQSVRVKRCGKSAPASRATGVARQTPPGARSRTGRELFRLVDTPGSTA